MPGTALIVIDMLNTYEHEDAGPLVESVRECLPRIVAARDEARRRDDVLLVYVNDNHDAWDAGREQLVDRALAGRHPDLVRPIAPDFAVPFIPKGRHSIFYETALDAYLRGYEIVVPPDAVAHIHPDLAQAALQMMERNMHALLQRTS